MTIKNCAQCEHLKIHVGQLARVAYCSNDEARGEFIIPQQFNSMDSSLITITGVMTECPIEGAETGIGGTKEVININDYI